VLSRGPVITWATRTPFRKATSLLAAAVARRLLAPLPVVRLAVHPADTGHASTLASIEKSLISLLERRHAAHYSELARAPAAKKRPDEAIGLSCADPGG
jgi:uncharacterized protein